jgi:hypothetical protein
MSTPTYTPLANIVLGSAASSVTFSSIPSTYRYLICVVVAQGSVNIEGRMRFNGDSGANYFFQRMSGSGSTATAGGGIGQTTGRLSQIAQATTTGALQMNIDIMDYSATDKHTSALSRANQSANGTEAFVNRWANTATVTSVQILTTTGNWASGSTFSLYGIIS